MELILFSLVRTRSHTPHQHINTLEKVRRNAAGSKTNLQVSLFTSLFPAHIIAPFFCETHISCLVFVCLFSAVAGPIITKTVNHLLLWEKRENSEI